MPELDLASLFGPEVRLSSRRLDLGPPPVDTTQARLRRRAEFEAGRTCALAALSALGCSVNALPTGPDRLPLWPPGFTGSISHTDTLCAAAAMATHDGFTGIGLDLEPAIPLPQDLAARVVGPAERANFEHLTEAGMGLGLAARIIFCCKEAAYKCQYPLSRAFLSYEDMAVTLIPQTQSFEAKFETEALPFKRNDIVKGKYSLHTEYIAAGAFVRGRSG